MRGYTKLINPTLSSATTYEVDLSDLPPCQVSIACDQPFTWGGEVGTFHVDPPAEGAKAYMMDIQWDPARDPTLTIETDAAPSVLDIAVAVGN